MHTENGIVILLKLFGHQNVCFGTDDVVLVGWTVVVVRGHYGHVVESIIRLVNSTDTVSGSG